MALDCRTDLHDRWQTLTPAAVRALDALIAGHFTHYVELTREDYARLLAEAEAVTR